MLLKDENCLDYFNLAISFILTRVRRCEIVTAWHRFLHLLPLGRFEIKITSAPISPAAAGRGVIFELSPKTGGGWLETTVHNFEGFKDGAVPSGNLLLDASGNIFGATSEGGIPACAGNLGCGSIFELQPKSGGWKFSILYIVPRDSPPSPTGSLGMDSAGTLYEALAGYSYFAPGSVIKLTKSSGYSESTIFDFSTLSTARGEYPDGGVTLDPSGNLYGTTSGGGSTSCGCGVIYEITP